MNTNLISYKLGQTSIVLRIKIENSSVTTGVGLTGLLFSSAGLRIATIADNEATATAYTQAGSTIETVTTLGTYATPTTNKCRFREVDATNHKGVYELQFDNARFAVSNAKSLLISISGASNAKETDITIPLVQLDPYIALPTSVDIWSYATRGLTEGVLLGNVDHTINTLTVADGVFLRKIANGNALDIQVLNGPGNGVYINCNDGHGIYTNGTISGFSCTGDIFGMDIVANSGPSAQNALWISSLSSTLPTVFVQNGIYGPAVEFEGGPALLLDGVGLDGKGHGLHARGAGANSHGIFSQGSSLTGVNDGFRSVAGTGGLDIRAQLAPDAIDSILAESGISAGIGLTNDTGIQLTSINLRQALSLIVSALAGKLAGADTTNVTIKGAGKPSGNTRIDATVDPTGRTSVNLKVPD